MWLCYVITIEHEGEREVQIVIFFRGALDVPALNDVTSLGICYCVW